jgi:hypothetical protein
MLNLKIIAILLALQVGGGAAAIGIWSHYHQTPVCVVTTNDGTATRAADQKTRSQIRVEDTFQAIEKVTDR